MYRRQSTQEHPYPIQNNIINIFLNLKSKLMQIIRYYNEITVQ